MTQHPTFIDRPFTFMKNHKGEAIFYLIGGMYSIADLEKLLKDVKESHDIQHGIKDKK